MKSRTKAECDTRIQAEANGKLLLMDDMEKFAFYSTSETAFSHMLSISILHYLLFASTVNVHCGHFRVSSIPKGDSF